MMKWAKFVLLGVMGLAVASSLLFFKQGGFGGGHGDFDKALFIMGLPWAAIPWPEIFLKDDFVWLVALPCALNVIAVLGIDTFVRVRRRSGTPMGT